jgi:type IV pilus assembly protein PilM
MPKMTEEDLRSAIIYEAENYIPLPIEEVYLDFQIIEPLQNHLDHFDVLIVALPKKIVDSYSNSLKMAGLQPIAFEVESQSIARALIKNEIATRPTLIIDLGETRSSFIIFSGTCIKFSFCLPVSSQLFTQAIVKNLGVTFAEAEKLKIEYGLEEKIKMASGDSKTEVEKYKGQVFESLVPSLVDLIQQIKRYQDYYRSYSSHEHLPLNNKGISSSILLCGGGANLKGLPEILILELKNSVDLGNPWVNIFPEGKKETINMSFEKSLGYTTAIGLALRGVKESK